MSRSKKWRLEWAFFLGENGRRQYIYAHHIRIVLALEEVLDHGFTEVFDLVVRSKSLHRNTSCQAITYQA